MKFLSPVLLLLCALTGCNSANQSKEAIRQGVIDYVSTKVNVAAMDVDVTSIAFKGSEADATVTFRAKGAGPASVMEMRYTLEQKSGKWVVKDKAQAGGAPHGGMAAPGGGEMPQGHPSLDPGEAKK